MFKISNVYKALLILPEECKHPNLVLNLSSTKFSTKSKFSTIDSTKFSTRIKAVLSDDEGMGQKAHRNPACIMPRCMGEDH